MTEYVVANRLKPSTIYNKEILIRNYLVPTLGELPLDAITEADVQRLKGRLVDQKPSSVNNMLTCLSTILKSAIEWQVIEAMPRIRKLKKQPPLPAPCYPQRSGSGQISPGSSHALSTPA